MKKYNENQINKLTPYELIDFKHFREHLDMNEEDEIFISLFMLKIKKKFKLSDEDIIEKYKLLEFYSEFYFYYMVELKLNELLMDEGISMEELFKKLSF
jgi:hypothetical protein